MRAAFAQLTTNTVGHSGQGQLTITGLCRLANVSSNSVYRYHPSIVLALRKYQQQHPARKPPARSKSDPVKREIADLRDELSKLVTLVDHYYGAYRETSVLLQRREPELAALRRNLHSKPVALTP